MQRKGQSIIVERGAIEGKSKTKERAMKKMRSELEDKVKAKQRAMKYLTTYPKELRNRTKTLGIYSCVCHPIVLHFQVTSFSFFLCNLQLSHQLNFGIVLALLDKVLEVVTKAVGGRICF